ncbi:hypothetical protein RHMOL_Rhmol07G0135400 [Rhododendron molle]|uniref:Uncharacterized protein n=1 Tax=Rhododendron molle TaxID=49168 RepID=A0ACC0N1P9_RHOML|nr:hypothetical protein RHMOL_Rhmol07G0135400 [Rhododendron molle]
MDLHSVLNHVGLHNPPSHMDLLRLSICPELHSLTICPKLHVLPTHIALHAPSSPIALHSLMRFETVVMATLIRLLHMHIKDHRTQVMTSNVPMEFNISNLYYFFTHGIVSAAANVMGSNAITVQFLLLLLVSVRSASAAINAITVQFRSYVMELVYLLFCFGCSVRIGARYGQ